MNNPFKLKNARLLMALAAIYPAFAHCAAGVAQFAVGEVSVRRGAAALPLARGQAIESGDSITTGGAGQAQIRFTDGGLVSLSPNSQFNIDKYIDDKDADKDSFAVSFVRGGMRALTGLIGKRNPKNYLVTTNTATIGIRGSGFSANHNADGSLDVADEQDGIVVCTNAGCIDLILGEVARVTSDSSRPARTAQRSNVRPLVARADLFQSVNPEIIDRIIPSPVVPPLPPIVVPPNDLINGVLAGLSAAFAFGDGGIDYTLYGGQAPSTGEGTFLNSLMIRHSSPIYSGSSELVVVEKTSPDAGSFGTVGTADDPGFIAWGYWDAGKFTGTMTAQPLEALNGDSSYLGVHYVAGRPTPQPQMPISGSAVYSLLGGTAPTAFYSGDSTLLTGTLLDAGLNVDFLGGRVNAFVNTEFFRNGQTVPVRVQNSGYLDGSSFYSDGSGTGEFFGLFTGDMASRAGLVYDAYDYTVGEVRGAAVLLKNGSSMQVPQMSAMFNASSESFDFAFYGGNPSTGSATFVGNRMYMHDDGQNTDDGEDSGSYSGRSALIAATGTSTLFAAQSEVSSFTELGKPTDTDWIGWGYWAKGSKSSSDGESSLTGVHYIVGKPTLQAQMPASGTAVYTKIGGTAPTATNGGTTLVGELVSATLNVNFGAFNNQVQANVSTQFVKNGAPVTVNLFESATIGSGARFSGGGSCGGNVSGFFVGDLATRAGIVYRQDSSRSESSPNGIPANIGFVNGAAGLARGAITPPPP